VIPEHPERWDLTPIFATGEAAVAASDDLHAAAEALARRSAGQLAVGDLGSFVDALGELEEALEELVSYATMRQHEDAAGAGVQEVVAHVQGAVTRSRAALERALDAWSALDDREAGRLLDDAVAGEAAAYRLRRTRTLARYRLAPPVEAAWSARTESARGRWASLQELLEARLRVPFDDGTGEREWGVGDLGTVLRRAEPSLRHAAQSALARAFGEIRDPLAIAWDAAVADRLAEDRLRGRAHPALETLDDEDFALAGFESLVAAVPQAYGTRQALLAGLARRLGLATFAVADVEAPLPGLPTLAHRDVVGLALAGLGALHPVLEEDGRDLVERRRIDGETRPGKQQYAVTTTTRLTPPAFLAYRYTGQAANVMLLGHELGHAVALARAAVGQPPIGRGWPGVAFEVPSLVAEIAAGDAFVDAHPGLARELRLVQAQDLGWSVFESIAFCLVELDVYATRAGGEILTGELLQGAFRRRFAELYGPDVAVGDEDALVAFGSWANYAIPARFYNFQYAVGALVALALHARRQDDPEAFGERYVAYLAAGRSASPVSLLAPFGLDLGPETWAEGLRELERRFALASEPATG
jgi:oligoendopeptidase F